MDQRIESFLTEVLALAGESPEVVHEGCAWPLPTARRSSEHGMRHCGRAALYLRRPDIKRAAVPSSPPPPPIRGAAPRRTRLRARLGCAVYCALRGRRAKVLRACSWGRARGGKRPPRKTEPMVTAGALVRLSWTHGRSQRCGLP
jgi:hypothetical protein